MTETIPTPRIRMTWLRVLIYLILVIAVIGIFQALAILLLVLLTDLDYSLLMNSSQDQIMQKIGIFNITLINLVSFAGMLLFTWGYRLFIDRKPLKTLGLSFSAYKRDFFKGMDWGMFAVTTGFLILLLGGYLSLDNVHLDLSNLIISITLFIIVALNEEIMIRGYVLGNLSESYNRYSALLISAAIFMLLHLANAHLSPIALLNLFLAGVLLGVYYIFQRNLWFSIGLHFTWNFFQGPVYGFEVSGLKTDRIFHSSVKGSALITGGDFGFEGSLLATVIILLMIYFIHQKYRIEISRK